MKILALLFECEVIVLGEPQAIRLSERVLDMILQIIRAHYNDRRLTVFTSNYLDEGSEHDPETLKDRIGVRLRSRLYQMCQTVVMDGEDYRKRFDNPQ
jgi:DNA replication protein DnaC